MTKNLLVAIKILRIILIGTTQFCGLYKIGLIFFAFSAIFNVFIQFINS
jgi:hypothetical protein